MHEPVSSLRDHLRDRLREVSSTRSPIFISRHGKVGQVILPVDEEGRVIIPPGVEMAVATMGARE